MRKILRSFLAFSIVLSIPSCTKEIEVDFPQKASPIITSIFNPNQHFIFHHSMSTSLSENYTDTIAPYQLKLFENNRPILDTTLVSPEYTSDIYPSIGSTYTLQLIKEGYPTLMAIDSIPKSMPYIRKAQRIFPTGSSDYGDVYCDISVTFKDPADENNYYEIIVTNKQKNPNDSFNEFAPTDIAWKNERDYQYWPSTIFFSDALFNGEEYTFRQKFYNSGDIVILRAVSRTYYLYRKYYTRHTYNQQQQGDFFDVFTKGEPQEMHSNVINGYGNFASYQATSRELEVIEK